MSAPLCLIAAPRVIELSIVRRKPEGGVRTVRVAKGESIALRVRCDEALAIHLHGYEVEMRTQAGSTASVTFTAAIVGRFPVTAHVHGADGAKGHEPTLLYLEVHPQ